MSDDCFASAELQNIDSLEGRAGNLGRCVANISLSNVQDCC